MTASYSQHILNFKRPGGTSRGILKTKETWFLRVRDGDKIGIGECAVFRGLSMDDVPDYEQKLQWVCRHIDKDIDWIIEELNAYPSIQFGVEMAFRSLHAKTPFELFPSKFTQGKATIPINGLIWMGDTQFMHDQIDEKLALGFNCIKMKIGAIAIEEELALLRAIRQRFDKDNIILRVDANGAFSPKEAQEVLPRLAELDIHSIEQPIKAGQAKAMLDLCRKAYVPIALDEELIGITSVTNKAAMLQTIQPQFIILKPSLVGGFKGSEEWIALAETLGIGWWITSALESNVGLNAIAQWTYSLRSEGHQGLGTGSLFTNNIVAPLEVTEGVLKYSTKTKWNFK